jgi:hypothetical protein
MTLRQRQPRIEDPAWLAVVRQMPCLVCGYPRSDPAHLRTKAPQYGKRECGMGEKPDDRWVLPLCRTHHDEQHRRNELAWWASKGIPDPFAVAIALYATRPATLRPLPATERPRKEPKRKPKADRARIITTTYRRLPSRKLESRSAFPPRGTRKLSSRVKERAT